MIRLEQYDVFSIPAGEIYFDEEFNCRRGFTLESVQELAASIVANGLKFPIVIQPAADVPGIPPGFKYRLVAGHRRFTAATRVNRWPEVPAQIVSGLSNAEAQLLNFLENLERKDLNPVEEALSIMRQFPTQSDREVAAAISRDKMWVNRRRQLLRQPEEIQQLVAAKRLTMQQLHDQIVPLHTVAAKLQAARRMTEGSSDEYRKTRNSYRMLTRPRSRKEIATKIAMMLELGLHEDYPILTRFAAWCGRGISDEEIDRDLAELANRTRE